ncbi:GNAT family N-acetyltransferase [Rathayibacter sp. KR2-224]|uniref:GNAT family N-acetyltransferase n=1 Tax=Rathayibacter sp. KR2-224 TaxID=3400913 RepID=UPI003C0F0EF8
MQIEDVWPLFKLRLLTPRLELRPVRDEDFPALVESALAGIHDPERMPFGVPWTDAPPEQLSPSLAQYHWRMRANVSPERWGISFTVLLGGDPIGIQELHAHNFANLRTVESGSWLTRSAQGKGLGTEMRAALLMFAFDILKAERAQSSAAAWNAASSRVSERLGYVPNGVHRVQTRPGEVTDEVGFRLGRDEFIRPDWRPQTEGTEAALRQLVVDAAA